MICKQLCAIRDISAGVQKKKIKKRQYESYNITILIFFTDYYFDAGVCWWKMHFREFEINI